MRANKKYFTVEELKNKLMKKPGFVSEYQKLQPEYEIACQIIDARLKKNMTQEDLAKKIGTGQAVISRLEGMNAKPSISLLYKVAQALQTKIAVNIQ
ncbi:MAG: helix-turn-helix transcriptional regulator [Candidatus Daviesbacteria bacterium]|nr:helix-turn-helix transcriptional regulator [Candidatus Daviesbacteria bacterium]